MCLRVVAYLHRGQFQPVADKTAIVTNATEEARGKAKVHKPSPLPYRYDSGLEVVTLDPKAGWSDGLQPRRDVDVDRLLGK